MSTRTFPLIVVLVCACAEETGSETGSAAGSETSTGAVDSDGATGPGPTTTTPMPMPMPMPTACEGDGSRGGCCDAEHPCAAPLLCGPLFGDGALFGETCNDCLADADCADGELCAPVLAGDGMMMGAPGGQRECVPPMSLADDAMCPESASGDLACASGHCAEVDIMGILIVHLCGACEVDSDCAAGKKCEAPPFDMAAGPVGPRCV